MSRLKKFAYALLSGYALMGTNIVFTLLSVPLALHYLKSNEKFGLWALTTQIAGYIALIDLGMSGISRILIDYKDRKDSSDYGNIIQTVWLVSVVQAMVIVVVGIGLGLGMGPLLQVPVRLQNEFTLLTIGQCALLAGSFVTRLFGYLLAAHQRYDVGNYTQIAAFLVNLGVMWLGFTQGQGVYSILWGQLASWFFTAVLTFVWCARLKFLPAAAYTGRPAWDRFYELLAYGWNVFLFLLGAQFINASQTIIIARMLGLEAAAVWSICTRSFSLILQGSSRPFDYSCAALAEMIVRQEKQRLFNRFRSIVIICSSLSVVAGAMFAVCNQPFVHLWTGGKIAWPTVNDALLAIWLFLTVVARCHVGLVGQAKSFGFLRYLYLLEGTFFVAVSLVVVRWGGVTAMLLVSIGGTMLLSLPYGIWRTAKYFQLSPKVVAVDWSRPALRLASLLGPVAAALWWLVRPLSPSAQLVIGGAGTGLLGVWLFFKCGLDEALQTELGRRIPDRLKPWLFSSGQSRGHSP